MCQGNVKDNMIFWARHASCYQHSLIWCINGLGPVSWPDAGLGFSSAFLPMPLLLSGEHSLLSPEIFKVFLHPSKVGILALCWLLTLTIECSQGEQTPRDIRSVGVICIFLLGPLSPPPVQNSRWRGGVCHLCQGGTHLAQSGRIICWFLGCAIRRSSWYIYHVKMNTHYFANTLCSFGSSWTLPSCLNHVPD